MPLRSLKPIQKKIKTTNQKQPTTMKTTAIRLILIAIMATMTISVSAQNTDKQRKSREELAQIQAQRIANSMAFDEKTTDRFIETYCQYHKELWALGPRLDKEKRPDKEQTNGGETRETMKQRLERSQKLLDLRKKYYDKYSKFLTDKQIERVYQLEKRSMNKLAKRGKRGGR